MNNVLYDWLTFTTKIHSLPDVIEMLGLSNVTFENKRGRYCYHDRISYNDINIMYNGREDMGICVEMSGQGCRTFETYGNGDYQGIFDMILDGYSPKSEKREMNITRLDVAYDDFENILDMNYFVYAAQKEEYVSRLENCRVIYDKKKGCTVGHGLERGGNIYIRIYDKKKERNRNDLEHWVRCEMQLRNELALGFIQLGGDVRENYFNVLNNYLRYVVPSSNTTNKRMVVTSPEWLRFIETWETVSIFVKPGFEYNILNLDSYVNNQLSGALTTYIDVVGVGKFLQNITEAQKGKKLNPKYANIREKCEENTDSILKYLEERGLK